MIEKIVLDHLDAELDVNAYLTMPDREKSFVLIEKSNGSETEHIYNALITVKSYAPTLYEAALLNEKVKAAMATLIEHDDVAKCRLNSDYPFPDTRLKRPRYQSVFEIVHY